MNGTFCIEAATLREIWHLVYRTFSLKNGTDDDRLSMPCPSRRRKPISEDRTDREPISMARILRLPCQAQKAGVSRYYFKQIAIQDLHQIRSTGIYSHMRTLIRWWRTKSGATEWGALKFQTWVNHPTSDEGSNEFSIKQIKRKPEWTLRWSHQYLGIE